MRPSRVYRLRFLWRKS